MPRSIFKYEPNDFEKAYDAELAKFVETIEVNQVVVTDTTDAIQEPIKTRKRMSSADWDSCLNK